MKQYSFLQESWLPNGISWSSVCGGGSIKYTYLVFRVISGPIKNLKIAISNSETPQEVEHYLSEFNNQIEINSTNTKDYIAKVCVQVGNSITSNIRLQLNSPTWKIDSIKTLEDGYVKLLVSHIMTAGGLTAAGAIMDRVGD